MKTPVAPKYLAALSWGALGAGLAVCTYLYGDSSGRPLMLRPPAQAEPATARSQGELATQQAMNALRTLGSQRSGRQQFAPPAGLPLIEETVINAKAAALVEANTDDLAVVILQTERGMVAMLGGEVMEPGKKLADGTKVERVDEHGVVLLNNDGTQRMVKVVSGVFSTPSMQEKGTSQ